jgi:IS5 family transposase
MKTIAEIISGAQALLDISFDVQQCFEEYLDGEQRTFMHMLRVIEEALPPVLRAYAGTGRKPYPYLPFIKSQLAKNHFNIAKTSKLIERLKSDPNLRLLCGFTTVPGKATFSRMLTYLASLDIFTETLAAITEKTFAGKAVYHVNRDSTAIPARETVVKEPSKKPEKHAKKRGRPAKNALREPKAPTELEKQTKQEAHTSLNELNKKCSWGCKKNSQGNVSFWKGYKLHLDVSDSGFPITACVTGANVHDSQLAIPMEKLTERTVTFFYSLMDAAYDSKTIDGFIRSRERIPIIDPNPRGNPDRPPLDPAKKERYKIRTTVERANSHLKDHLIPKDIYVKGYTKVSFVLMSAIVCLAALKHLQFIL